MSVDLSRLSAHLPADEQTAVRRAYRQRAKSATTAFLLCFFLGIFGAHAFYLGRTWQGILRLILSPLIIPGLIWELIDLFHIDHDVYEQNLKLAEELVAQAALAVPNSAVEAEAVAQLDALVHEQEAHASAADAVPAPAAPAAGLVFAAVVTEPISADADAHTAADADALAAPVAPAPPIWPIAGDAPAVDRDAYPALTEQAPAGGAEAGSDSDITAAMLALAAALADEEAPVVQGAPAGEIRSFAVADPPESPIAPDGAEMAAPNEAPAVTPRRAVDPTDSIGAVDAPLLADVGETPTGPIRVVLPRASAPPDAPAVTLRRAVDPTDSIGAVDAPLLADVGETPTGPIRVVLPQAHAAPDVPVAAAWAAPVAESLPDAWGDPTSEPVGEDVPADFALAGTGAMAKAPGDEDLESSTLVLVAYDEGDIPTPEGEPPATLAELAASAPAAAPPAAAEESAMPPAVDAGAERAGDEAGGHEETSAKRVVKRVRVIRRLVVNGQVVHEATAEQVVDADADTDATARTLQAALGSTDPQTLAALSNQGLPDDGTTGQATGSAGIDQPGA